ncbi:hypothetical protein P171DRAFT_287043 [Karstenula rhodostoma CBS 690.94]|uniref:Uncharacterized protein n=1 Tax=Karstenula rhodostoma CBS 690.94 TaxID=1392251 RepID=A0A9P4UD36_9PLEO|nr:hypothetical protein P171DRAFT_287043 [Karstenula rhodostoma CBS 690.94]
MPPHAPLTVGPTVFHARGPRRSWPKEAVPARPQSPGVLLVHSRRPTAPATPRRGGSLLRDCCFVSTLPRRRLCSLAQGLLCILHPEGGALEGAHRNSAIAIIDRGTHLVSVQ